MMAEVTQTANAPVQAQPGPAICTKARDRPRASLAPKAELQEDQRDRPQQEEDNPRNDKLAAPVLGGDAPGTSKCCRYRPPSPAWRASWPTWIRSAPASFFAPVPRGGPARGHIARRAPQRGNCGTHPPGRAMPPPGMAYRARSSGPAMPRRDYSAIELGEHQITGDGLPCNEFFGHPAADPVRGASERQEVRRLARRNPTRNGAVRGIRALHHGGPRHAGLG